jgi:hypothetical protein
MTDGPKQLTRYVLSVSPAACGLARLMAVELKAGLVCDQRLKKRLALDDRESRDVRKTRPTGWH